MPTTASSTPKRDHLLDTAIALFYRDGFHAVGIDTILKEAGLAKMTLYHHFSSKEELILAALERRAEKLDEALREAMDNAGSSARKKLLALFDWYRDWFDSPDFNGCAFIRAAGEYGALKSPIHQLVARQKARARQSLYGLFEQMDVSDPESLAAQVHLLLQGAIVTAHISGEVKAIDDARNASLQLLKLAAR